MTPGQIERIPDRVLYGQGAVKLREWLHARGLRMTLAELDAERRRRRDNPPGTHPGPPQAAGPRGRREKSAEGSKMPGGDAA